MPYHPDRRSFLIASGITALASTKALGANDTLRIGVIGAGQRMNSLLHAAEESTSPVQFVAVSDVYKPRAEAVKERAAKATGPSHAETTLHDDYREVAESKDIDAILIATPDHWHVRAATAALAAGKDVYLEKPVTHTLEEGAILQKAVRSSNRILQCGMQQRSWTHFRDAVNIIQSGEIGKVHQVRTYWWQNYQNSFLRTAIDNSQLDWKQWLGGAPDQPISEELYFHWRWYWNFGGGAMTDLFAHWIDVVHWAMKADEPSQAFLLGDKYYFKDWDCPDTIQAAFRYPGFDVVYEGMMASGIDDGGLDFRGTDATLKLTRGGFSVHREGLKPDQNPIITEKTIKDGTILHMQNFFDCIKSRKEPNAPVEAGIAAARAGQIGNLAYKNGGQTKWPAKS